MIKFNKIHLLREGVKVEQKIAIIIALWVLNFKPIFIKLLAS